jgi:prepilin peptidase CpaA
MFDLPLHSLVFLASVVLFTLVTAWTDMRTRRIPNAVTLPMWIAGWIYQIAFFQTDGLLEGLAGFGVGFLTFFTLWMIGSAGGGDVKLLGALSVWLGLSLTLKVMLASLIFVIAGTFGVLFSNMLTKGWKSTRKQFSRETSGKSGRKNAAVETIEQKQKRRVMAFAVPVAFATWSVLLLFRNQW